MAESEQANIKIESSTRDELRALKVGGETYDEVITRLLEEVSGL